MNLHVSWHRAGPGAGPGDLVLGLALQPRMFAGGLRGRVVPPVGLRAPRNLRGWRHSLQVRQFAADPPSRLRLYASKPCRSVGRVNKPTKLPSPPYRSCKCVCARICTLCTCAHYCTRCWRIPLPALRQVTLGLTLQVASHQSMMSGWCPCSMGSKALILLDPKAFVQASLMLDAVCMYVTVTYLSRTASLL